MKRVLLLLMMAAALPSEAVAKASHKSAKAAPRPKLQTESVDQEFARYLGMAKELKTRRDTGDLNEGDVLKVLDSAGLSDQSSFATGFRPFEVRVYRGLWIWPLRAGIVSSEFGKRRGRQHQGIDIAADLGVPVRAVAPGEVIYAGNELRGYGNVVILRHDNETSTLYAHNDSLEVQKGQRVRTGEVISRLGSTGHSTGPHLHFEVRKKNKPVNPRKVLPKSRF